MHAKELERVREVVRDELVQEHMARFQKVTQELQLKHQQELEEVRAAVAREYGETVEQLRHQMALQEREYLEEARDLEEARVAAVRSVEQLRAQLAAAEEVILSSEHELARVLAEADERLSTELIKARRALNEEHEKDLNVRAYISIHILYFTAV